MTGMSATEGYIVLLVLGILFIGIGRISQKTMKMETAEDFFVAGRGAPWRFACISLIATWIWATTTMAAGEGAYNFGWSGGWYYPLGGGIGILIAIPILRRVKKIMPFGLTFPEFIRRRVGDSAGWVNTIGSILFLFFSIWLQVIGAGIVCESMLGIPFTIGAILTGIVVMIYSAVCGVWGVLLMDVVQATVIAFGMSLLTFIGISKVGGPSAFYDILQTQTMVKGALDWINIKALVIYGLPLTIGYLGYGVIEQNVWQRAWAINTDDDFSKAAKWAFLGWVPIPLISGILGLLGIALGVKASGTDVIPLTMCTILPKWGVVVGALIILSAITSTMDSCICSLVSHIVVDIYEPYILKGKKATPKQMLKLSQMLTLIVGLFIVLFSARKFSLLFLNIFINCVLPPLFIPFILSAYIPRLNRKATTIGMWVGMIIGVTFSTINQFTGNPPMLLNYAIVYLLSIGIPGIGTLIAPEEPFDFNKLSENIHV